MSLCYSQQLYLKYECRTARYVWLRELAISHFCRNVYLPFIAYTHLLHGYNPTLNQFVQTEGNRSATPAAVKFLSAYSPPGIVGGDDTAWCRMLAIVLSPTDDLVIDTFREWLYSLFFGFRFQPFLIGLYVFFLLILFRIF